MSVRVDMDANHWSLEFTVQTAHSMAESKAETVEQFAQALERIAADLRRMYPPAGAE